MSSCISSASFLFWFLNEQLKQILISLSVRADSTVEGDVCVSTKTNNIAIVRIKTDSDSSGY
jgi:hypothetical protein